MTHDFPQIILVLALFGTQTSKHMYFFAKFYLKFMKRVKRGYVPCKYIVPWEKVELLLGISFSAEDHKYFSYFCHFPPSLWDFFSHMQKHHHIYRNYSIIHVIRISMSIYHTGETMHRNTYTQSILFSNSLDTANL